MEIFHEETVVPSNYDRARSGYNRLRVISWLFLASAVLFTLIFLMTLSMPYQEGGFTDFLLFNVLPVAVMMVVSYVLYGVFRRKKHSRLVDFDYTFVSGELRIAKVLNGRRRRPVAKLSTSDISVIGQLSSDKYLRYSTMPGIKKLIATPNEDEEDIYFAFCTIGGQKTLLIFQPSETLLIAIKKVSGRSIEWAIKQ